MDCYINFTEEMAAALEYEGVTPSERGEIIRAVLAYLFYDEPLPRFTGKAANECAAAFFHEAVMANPDGPTKPTNEELQELFG